MTAGPAPAKLSDAGIPAFTYPEQAAAALGRIARWAEWRARPAGHVVTPRASTGAAGGPCPQGPCRPTRQRVGRRGGGRGASWRLRHHRRPEPPGLHAGRGRCRPGGAGRDGRGQDRRGHAQERRRRGRPRYRQPAAAAEALAAIRATLSDAGLAEQANEFLVQEQVRDGVEMIVGMSHDPAFGPLVLAGLGGTMVELLGDMAVRITPLSDTDVDEMLRSLRSYRLLTGYRQSPPLDVAAFAELLHRVSAMVEDIPEITELDLNPVFVREHGAVAADMRIRLSG